MSREKYHHTSLRGRPRRERGLIVARRERIRKVRDLMLRGETNQTKIAAALGVTGKTIGLDMKEIFEVWLKEDPETSKAKRARRVRQLEANAVLSRVSYERSRLDEEEVTTRTHHETCSECRGTGKQGEEPCGRCDGTGKIRVEVVTRRIKGQAGDASFLTEYRKCMAECARLEGLYRTGKRGAKKQVIQGGVHLHVSNPWLGAPPEAILEAKAAIEKLRESIALEKVLEEDVQDVAFEEKREDENP